MSILVSACVAMERPWSTNVARAVSILGEETFVNAFAIQYPTRFATKEKFLISKQSAGTCVTHVASAKQLLNSTPGRQWLGYYFSRCISREKLGQMGKVSWEMGVIMILSSLCFFLTTVAVLMGKRISIISDHAAFSAPTSRLQSNASAGMAVLRPPQANPHINNYSI